MENQKPCNSKPQKWGAPPLLQVTTFGLRSGVSVSKRVNIGCIQLMREGKLVGISDKSGCKAKEMFEKLGFKTSHTTIENTSRGMSRLGKTIHTTIFGFDLVRNESGSYSDWGWLVDDAVVATFRKSTTSFMTSFVTPKGISYGSQHNTLLNGLTIALGDVDANDEADCLDAIRQHVALSDNFLPLAFSKTKLCNCVANGTPNCQKSGCPTHVKRNIFLSGSGVNVYVSRDELETLNRECRVVADVLKHADLCRKNAKTLPKERLKELLCQAMSLIRK